MTSAQPNSVREGVDIALRLGPSLATGRLEAILPDYALPCTPLSMLIVPERAGIARVRLLGDFLATQICRFPGIKRHGQCLEEFVPAGAKHSALQHAAYGLTILMAAALF